MVDDIMEDKTIKEFVGQAAIAYVSLVGIKKLLTSCPVCHYKMLKKDTCIYCGHKVIEKGDNKP